MFTTLVAVIAALALGHLAPAAVAALRDWRWFGRWLVWLQAHGGATAGRYGLWLALAPLLLPVALLQWGLVGRFYGLPALLFGIAMLVLCWGPRDLDRDVEAVIDADDAEGRVQALSQLQSAGGSLREDVPSLVDAVVFNALRRWFAPLFWFLLLGPFGVLAYRLLAQAVQGPQAAQMVEASRAGGAWALRLLEWPVAQLMTLSMALVGNFDPVFNAWREAKGNTWQLDTGFLAAAARASVKSELAEEAEEYADEGMVQTMRELPELRDAMSLVWRILLLWLALLAVFVIGGWVS